MRELGVFKCSFIYRFQDSSLPHCITRHLTINVSMGCNKLLAQLIHVVLFWSEWPVIFHCLTCTLNNIPPPMQPPVFVAVFSLSIHHPEALMVGTEPFVYVFVSENFGPDTTCAPNVIFYLSCQNCSCLSQATSFLDWHYNLHVWTAS